MARRRELGLTQETLALLSAVSRSLIQQIEIGAILGSVEAYELIARTLNIPVNEICPPDAPHTNRPKHWRKVEPIQPAARPRRMNFIPDATYNFTRKSYSEVGDRYTENKLKRWRFLRDVGQLYLFENVSGGYVESFTNFQLSNYQIEVENGDTKNSGALQSLSRSGQEHRG